MSELSGDDPDFRPPQANGAAQAVLAVVAVVAAIAGLISAST